MQDRQDLSPSAVSVVVSGHKTGAHVDRRNCQRPIPSRLPEPPDILPEANAGPIGPLTNTTNLATSAVSVVVSPRPPWQGEAHISIVGIIQCTARCQCKTHRTSTSATMHLNLNPASSTPTTISLPKFDIPPEAGSCRVCLAPSLHSSAANQRSNLSQVHLTLFSLFTLVSSPNMPQHHRCHHCQWPAETYA